MNSRKQGSLGAILMAFYHTDHVRGQRNKSECVPTELAIEDNLNTNKNNYIMYHDAMNVLKNTLSL